MCEGNLPSSLEYVTKTALYSQVRDFAMALRARKVSGAFEKRPLGLVSLEFGSFCLLYFILEAFLVFPVMISVFYTLALHPRVKQMLPQLSSTG